MWPFGKKSESETEELNEVEATRLRASERYAGKPFLKLLDSYVLRAIGHLDQDTEAMLEAMLPKLQQTFRSTGSWIDIVEEQMEFASDLPTEIKRRWDDGRERFIAEAKSEPDPLEFAYVFVDTNFQPTNH